MLQGFGNQEKVPGIGQRSLYNFCDNVSLYIRLFHSSCCKLLKKRPHLQPDTRSNQMDGQMDGRTNGWMDGRMDRKSRRNRKSEIYNCTYSHTGEVLHVKTLK